VFVALAQSASQLADCAVLSGWLHRTTRNLAANTVRSDVRRRGREQEAAAMSELLSSEPNAAWQQVAPHLDAALSELSDADRDALLLRYFERKSAGEMARILGISDEAAQKRVSRAVERLRELFAKRGTAIGAGGLVAVVSAHAVHAAPAGLASGISAAVAIAGTGVAATTATAAKTVAMTTLQKTLIAATIVAAASAGLYQSQQASTLRTQIRTLQQQQQGAGDAHQLEQLKHERDAAVARQIALEQDNESLRQTAAEVPKLRGEVARLRTAQQQQSRTQAASIDMNDPAMQNFLAMKAKATEITRFLERMPEKAIPELKLLTDVDWLSATKEARLDSDVEVRKTLSNLRSLAKNRMPMGRSLDAFVRANNGQLPTDLSQLKPFFNAALGDAALNDATLDAIFQRYKLLRTGAVSDLPPDAWVIAETAPVDREYDSRAKFGIGRSTVIGTGTNSAGDPEDNSY
jgi:RNA polymerase sigma factor (sigma-70 family)